MRYSSNRRLEDKIAVVIALCFVVMIVFIAIGLVQMITATATPEVRPNIGPGDITGKYMITGKVISYYIYDVYGNNWEIDRDLYKHLNLPVIQKPPFKGLLR